MFYYFLFGVAIFFSYLFFSANQYKQVPIILENWYWDKQSGTGIKQDPRFKQKPTGILNGYKLESKLYSFGSGRVLGVEEEYLEYPALGKGYFGYKKIGDKITYYSSGGEILWRKNSSSYPIASWTGGLNFLVSGDGNQVLLIDINGNLTGTKQTDGRFLTDMAHTLHKGSAILFSGGEIYRLDEKGNLLRKITNLRSAEKGLLFYKSIALSPSGSLMAIHFLENNKDYVTVVDSQGESKRTFQLPHPYPHKLYLSVSDRGEVLLNANDILVMFSVSGEILHKTDKKRIERVHYISFAQENLFVGDLNDSLVFLNQSGQVIRQYPIRGSKRRILPSPEKGQFFLETELEIISFQTF